MNLTDSSGTYQLNTTKSHTELREIFKFSKDYSSTAGVENQTSSNLGRDFKFERDRPSIKSYSNSTISTSIEELNFPDNYDSKERPNTVEHRNETETWSREDRSGTENGDKLGKKTSENMK